MTAKEAIKMLRTIKRTVALGNQKFEDALDVAIEALELKQRIIENGYTGKEAEFRIGGRLFGIREKAQ